MQNDETETSKYQLCIRDGCPNWFRPPPGVHQVYCCRKCRKLDRKESKKAGLYSRQMLNELYKRQIKC